MAEENSQIDNSNDSIPVEIKNSDINSLQEEIGGLIDNINQFISGLNNTTEECEYESNLDTLEKEDDPTEKYTGDDLNFLDITSTPTFEPNPETESETEIDWSVAGPVLQKHIVDLERLHSLNLATSSLIQKLQELTCKKSMHAYDP